MTKPSAEGQQTEHFQTLLNQALSKIKAQELPALPTKVPDPAWVKWLNKLKEWLENLLPHNTSFSLTSGPWLKILVATFFFLLILAIVFGILALVRHARQAHAAKTKFGGTPWPEDNDPRAHAAALSTLIQQGRWNEAARLQWSLFLFRAHHPLSRTPAEISRTESHSDQFNRAMFFSQAQRQDFDSMTSVLTNLEGP